VGRFIEEKEKSYLGTVKIIQKGITFNESTGYYETNLDKEFQKLDENIFFSKGTNEFFESLKNIETHKDKILHALNEIHIKGYTESDFNIEADVTFYYGYKNSLMRDCDYEFLSPSSKYFEHAQEMLNNLKTYAGVLIKEEISVDDLESIKQNRFVINMLFGSTIATLETYLGDAFKYNILEQQDYLLSFVRFYQYPDNTKKYTLKEIGLHGKNITSFIKKEVKNILQEISFHNIDIVGGLYKNILNVRLPKEFYSFKEPISKRHNIFHRNGKDSDGNELNIEKNEVIQLIEKVENFIKDTERILKRIL
jgi:hypothetical protein